MSRGIFHYLLGFCTRFFLEFLFCFRSPFQFPILAQDCLLNGEGHTETPDFPVLASFSCLCHEKSVSQALLYFLSCRLKAGG